MNAYYNLKLLEKETPRSAEKLRNLRASMEEL